jgi:hypothetical protein
MDAMGMVQSTKRSGVVIHLYLRELSAQIAQAAAISAAHFAKRHA